MEEGKCGFCHTGDESKAICGTLYKGRVDGKTIAAHHKCMQYSAKLIQYTGKCFDFGGFKKKDVLKEIHRGYQLACCLCRKDKSKKKRGATSGCALKSCRKTFHYYCAAINPDTVTKRFKAILLMQRNKEVTLYRVFCSLAHEEDYRRIFTGKDILNENTYESSIDEEDQGSDSGDIDRTSPDNTHADDEDDDEPAKKKQKTNDEAHDDESGTDSPGMGTMEVIPKIHSQYKVLQESIRPKGQFPNSDNYDQSQDDSLL